MSQGPSTDTDAVLASTETLLAWTRGQSLVAYADDDWAPISELDCERIARQMGAAVMALDLGAGVQEIGLPAYLGHPVIAVQRDLAPPLRRLALRHGLAHLVAGELEIESGAALRFMSSSQDDMALEERRADLFALADLLPDRVLAQFLELGISDDERGMELEAMIRSLAPPWSAPRIADRAELRWRLFLRRSA